MSIEKPALKPYTGTSRKTTKSFSGNPKFGTKIEIQPVLPKNTVENQPDP
jgi:hypothetical protein